MNPYSAIHCHRDVELTREQALAPELSALGVRVRAVTAQHGDIPHWLAERGCHLSFVRTVLPPTPVQPLLSPSGAPGVAANSHPEPNLAPCIKP